MSPQPVAALPALTGIRFVAATLIVVQHNLGHFGIRADFGRPFAFMQAVSFFMVLSGFILAYNYPALDRPGERARFWLARWARVWPAHLAALLFLFVGLPWSRVDLTECPSIAALALNVSLVHAWWPGWNSFCSYNTPSWSVSAEWGLYLLFPWLIRDWSRTAWWKLGGVLVLTVGLIGACNRSYLPAVSVLTWQPTTGGLMYVHPLGRLWAFTLGIGLVSVFRRLQGWRCGPVAATVVEVSALGSAWYLMAHSAVWAHQLKFAWPALGDAGFQWLLHQGGFSLPAFAAVILVLAWGRGGCSWLLSRPAAVRLGELSFAIYLLHDPLLRLCGARLPRGTQHHFWTSYPLFWATLIGLAYLSWRCVERPCRRALVGLAPGTVARPPVLASVEAPYRRAA